jgi:hypothetical protein
MQLTWVARTARTQFRNPRIQGQRPPRQRLRPKQVVEALTRAVFHKFTVRMAHGAVRATQ